MKKLPRPKKELQNNQSQQIIIVQNPGENPKEKAGIDELAFAYKVGADSRQILRRWEFLRREHRNRRLPS